MTLKMLALIFVGVLGISLLIGISTINVYGQAPAERIPGYMAPRAWFVEFDSGGNYGNSNKWPAVRIIELQGVCLYVSVEPTAQATSRAIWGISKQDLPKGAGCQ